MGQHLNHHLSIPDLADRFPVQSKDERRWAVQRARLLLALRHLSRFTAFSGTDHELNLVARFKSVKSLKRALHRARREGAVLSFSRVKVVEILDGDRPEFRTRRTIYIRSELPPDIGARHLAALVRIRGKQSEEMTTNDWCGQLRCTPGQFKNWLKEARFFGFVVVRYALVEAGTGDRRRVDRWRLVSSGPAIGLLDCRVTDPKWINDPVIAAERTLEEKVLSIVRSARNGVCSMSKDQIAKLIGVHRATVTRAVKRLVATRVLWTHDFAKGCGRGSLLSERPLTEQEILRYTPHSTKQWKKRLGDTAKKPKTAAARRPMGVRRCSRLWRSATSYALIETAAVAALNELPDYEFMRAHGGVGEITKDLKRFIRTKVGALVRDQTGWSPEEVARCLGPDVALAHLARWWDRHEKRVGIEQAAADRDRVRAPAAPVQPASPEPRQPSLDDLERIRRQYPWFTPITLQGPPPPPLDLRERSARVPTEEDRALLTALHKPAPVVLVGEERARCIRAIRDEWIVYAAHTGEALPFVSDDQIIEFAQSALELRGCGYIATAQELFFANCRDSSPAKEKVATLAHVHRLEQHRLNYLAGLLRTALPEGREWDAHRRTGTGGCSEARDGADRSERDTNAPPLIDPHP